MLRSNNVIRDVGLFYLNFPLAVFTLLAYELISERWQLQISCLPGRHGGLRSVLLPRSHGPKPNHLVTFKQQ